MPTDPPVPGVTPPTPTPQPTAPTVEELQAKVAELSAKFTSTSSELENVKAESIERRQTIKRLKEAAGLPPDGVSMQDEIAKAVAAERSTVRRAFLERSVEVLAVKAGAHDPADVIRALELEGIEIDEAKWTLKDAAKAGEKIAALRTAKPYLFKAEGAPPADPTPTPQPTPDPGRPTLGPGGTAHAQWQTLMKAGDTAAAAKFYREHFNEIRAAGAPVRPN